MSDLSLPPNLREFHCIHCHGKIRIPKDLPPTTGPCPHCKGTITSPVPEHTPPSSYLPPAPTSYAEQPPAPVSAPAVAPIPTQPAYVPQPASAPSQPAYVPPPAPAPPPEQTPNPQSAIRNPQSNEPTPLPQRRTTPAPEDPQPTARNVLPVFILMALLAAFAAGAGFFVFKEMQQREKIQTAAPLPKDPAIAESQYIRIGWQQEARTVLRKFLAGKTVDEKLPYIINGDKMKAQLEAFYGGSIIDDQDTPEAAFSTNDLSEEDRRRGLFLLEFDQPPQFDMKEFFRPLASLEVQYGLTEADLLLATLARVGNFATQPLRVNAFFKKTPEGLKLDWETFAQTKYGTLQTLVELPEAGQGGVFRVIISEDVPETGKELPEDLKAYRISDPASPEARARINVKIDSDIGRALSVINWIGLQNRPINRTATIELKWVGADQPKLEISRFICWEFLHLGGVESGAAR